MINELKIFVPGHITGFFEIFQNENPLLKGSRGAGITLDEGVTTTTKIYEGTGNINITVNEKTDCLNTISQKTVDIILKKYDIDISKYDIYINHDLSLKIGAGFGTSACFALGISCTLPLLLGVNISFKQAGEIAHLAEIHQSSGLGDVISEMYGGCVIRIKEGTPQKAIIDKIPISQPIYIITKTLSSIETSKIIENKEHQMIINKSGSRLIKEIINNPSIENFIKLSYKFSQNTKLVTDELNEIIIQLQEDSIGSSMAMLGNTAFALSYTPDTQVDNCNITKINTTGAKYIK